MASCDYMLDRVSVPSPVAIDILMVHNGEGQSSHVHVFCVNLKLWEIICKYIIIQIYRSKFTSSCELCPSPLRIISVSIAIGDGTETRSKYMCEIKNIAGLWRFISQVMAEQYFYHPVKLYFMTILKHFYLIFQHMDQVKREAHSDEIWVEGGNLPSVPQSSLVPCTQLFIIIF